MDSSLPTPTETGPAIPKTNAAPEYGPIVIPPMIEQANQAFRRDLPELLRTHPKQWVAYWGDKCYAFSRDKTELILRCEKDGLPDDEFMVNCVEDGAASDLIIVGPLTFSTDLLGL